MQNRKISFRAWNTQENKMLYRKLFEMNWYSTEKNDEAGSHCWGAISGGQERFMEIMQFTGLLDKNGKEIYEGDIIKEYSKFDGEMQFKVTWRDYYWTLEYSTNKSGYHSVGDVPLKSWKSIEVIGNVYQNPELLNTK